MKRTRWLGAICVLTLPLVALGATPVATAAAAAPDLGINPGGISNTTQTLTVLNFGSGEYNGSDIRVLIKPLDDPGVNIAGPGCAADPELGGSVCSFGINNLNFNGSPCDGPCQHSIQVSYGDEPYAVFYQLIYSPADGDPTNDSNQLYGTECLGPSVSNQWKFGGTAGDDVLSGTAGRDCIGAGAGDDVIAGKGGSDFLVGHAGDDIVIGGSGPDGLLGGLGDDTLNAADGKRDAFFDGLDCGPGTGDTALVDSKDKPKHCELVISTALAKLKASAALAKHFGNKFTAGTDKKIACSAPRAEFRCKASWTFGGHHHAATVTVGGSPTGHIVTSVEVGRTSNFW